MYQTSDGSNPLELSMCTLLRRLPLTRQLPELGPSRQGGNFTGDKKRHWGGWANYPMNLAKSTKSIGDWLRGQGKRGPVAVALRRRRNYHKIRQKSESQTGGHKSWDTKDVTRLNNQEIPQLKIGEGGGPWR